MERRSSKEVSSENTARNAENFVIKQYRSSSLEFSASADDSNDEDADDGEDPDGNLVGSNWPEVQLLSSCYFFTFQFLYAKDASARMNADDNTPDGGEAELRRQALIENLVVI